MKGIIIIIIALTLIGCSGSSSSSGGTSLDLQIPQFKQAFRMLDPIDQAFVINHIDTVKYGKSPYWCSVANMAITCSDPLPQVDTSYLSFVLVHEATHSQNHDRGCILEQEQAATHRGLRVFTYLNAPPYVVTHVNNQFLELCA